MSQSLYEQRIYGFPSVTQETPFPTGPSHTCLVLEPIGERREQCRKTRSLRARSPSRGYQVVAQPAVPLAFLPEAPLEM